MESKKCYSIYVIRLRDDVLKHRRFRDANPEYIEGKPCAYVGETEKTPRERFEEHKSGYRKNGLKWFNTYVHNYGLWLSKRQFKRVNDTGIVSKVESKRLEAAKAAELRAKGWAVWYN